MGAKYVQNFTGKSLKSLTSSSEILASAEAVQEIKCRLVWKKDLMHE